MWRYLTSVLLASALLMAAGGDARAATTQLYVAPWGNDAWPGTAEHPFATPAAAQRAVRGRTRGMTGDIVVNLRAGTYTLDAPLRFTATAGDGGSGGHAVIYQAFGYGTPQQEAPTISGGRPVTGWRPAEDVPGAWKADVGALQTRQLFVGGRRAQRAALGTGLPAKAVLLPEGYAVRSTVPQAWQRPRDMELVFNGGKGGLPYSEARCGIRQIRGDKEWSVITPDEPCFANLKRSYRAEVKGAIPAAPTDVENSISLMRRPGMWYLDRSRPDSHVLYYRPRAGEDMTSVAAIAPVLDRLVIAGGTAAAPLRDMTLRGLTFAHATWLAPSEPAGFPQIIGSWIYGAKRMPGHVAFRATERLRIEGNRFTQLGGQALVVAQAGRDNVVRGNTVDDVSGGGIELRGRATGNRIEDNDVRDIGVDYRGSIAIAVEGAPNASVAHNLVRDVPYTGIWGEAPRGLRIAGNLVVGAVRTVPDGGGIYVHGRQGRSFASGAVVERNVVRGSGGVGVYLDVGADQITARRNVLHGNDHAVSGVEPGRLRLAGNYWDDATPFWWPEDAATGGVELNGNTLLSRSGPEAACQGHRACAEIVAGAGPRSR